MPCSTPSLGSEKQTGSSCLRLERLLHCDVFIRDFSPESIRRVGALGTEVMAGSCSSEENWLREKKSSSNV